MKRRSFLAGLLALPLVKFLPTPKPAPAPMLAAGSDQLSIWFVTWGDSIYSAEQIVTPCRAVRYKGAPVLPMRTNWLKKELNK